MGGFFFLATPPTLPRIPKPPSCLNCPPALAFFGCPPALPLRTLGAGVLSSSFIRVERMSVFAFDCGYPENLPLVLTGKPRAVQTKSFPLLGISLQDAR